MTTGSIREFKETFEDYKLNKLSASEIKYILEALDEEEEKIIFNKNKSRDMYLALVKTYKIGKYKYSQLKIMEGE